MPHPSERATDTANGELRIVTDDLTGPAIAALLTEHLAEMAAHSPAESMHALDLAALRHPRITFWTAWDERALAGCAALKHLDDYHAEIKSMRTAATHQRRGIASTLLRHLVAEATTRGYRRLSLETGAQDFFRAAQRLYTAHGFDYCAPFGDYRPDPNSVFMTRTL
ncbi:GNAT family N-acetyltransferase [Nocardia sp. NBC_00508]|uniref:GNAT family N-acetyltransferase n=1 Tax=Nocardia sp. NBC_00508 TaxID=2975992 RepID=UPI002E81A577|nr:GNAT family N-acetyltransferase [Nocardia sp. NBC_00508]WUD65219.1 GNAT family N-acetyltransferase [Nocardia sp. NBC_00508]